MLVTVTIRLNAESEQELTETFPAAVKKYVAATEKLRKKGTFGPAKSVEIRYLVIGGMWKSKDEKEATKQASETEAAKIKRDTEQGQ